MIRVAVDANVLASGVLGLERAESTPGEIVRRWRARAFGLVTSDHLIAEVARTLADPWFAARIPSSKSAASLVELEQEAERTLLTMSVTGVATHPEDDLVLATAVSAAADYLVTGDRQLLKLGAYQGVRIVSPADFLAVLGRSSGAPNAGGDPDDG